MTGNSSATSGGIVLRATTLWLSGALPAARPASSTAVQEVLRVATPDASSARETRNGTRKARRTSAEPRAASTALLPLEFHSTRPDFDATKSLPPDAASA